MTRSPHTQTDLPHCAGVLRDEAATELMRLLGVTVIPTALLLDPATGEAQPLPLQEAVAATAAVTAPADKEGEAGSSVFKEALRRHEEGDWAGALEGFVRALAAEQTAQRADAAYNLAALLHMLGKARLAVHYTAMVRARKRAIPPRSLICSLTSSHINIHPPHPFPLHTYTRCQALEARPEDLTVHVLLGTVLAESEKEAVVDAYRRLLPALAAQEAGGGGYHRAAHRLAVLTGEGPSAKGAAPEYVREVFDAMAEEFESKLVDHLGYKARVVGA